MLILHHRLLLVVVRDQLDPVNVVQFYKKKTLLKIQKETLKNIYIFSFDIFYSSSRCC